MKTLILYEEDDFSHEADLAQKILDQLSPILHLENKFIEVNLVGDETMKTNVHSYEARSGVPRPDIYPAINLGEVYLNPKQIKERGEDFSFMLIHGLLHLLGYDHLKDDDRIKMERQEQFLLSQLS